jgi:lipoyl(octanoyl) transferase
MLNFAHLQFIHDPVAHDGSLNMAIDEALSAAAPVPTLRVYRWKEPSVSFGYFGHWREVRERWPGRALVRRWTGGGEVPHGEDLTYTLIVPRDHAFCRIGVRESYGAIHRIVAALLPGAELAAADAAANAACFARPVVFDVLVAGAKVAGAAQRRTRHGLLHQGSIQGAHFPADFPAHLASAFATKIEAIPLPSSILTEATRLDAEKYGNPAWLQRA